MVNGIIVISVRYFSNLMVWYVMGESDNVGVMKFKNIVMVVSMVVSVVIYGLCFRV